MINAVIPKEDLNIINTVLNGGHGKVQTIIKGPRGEMKTAKTREPINSGYVVGDFRGRVLRHQVSIFKEGHQIIVAEAGQRYDDIPIHIRKTVILNESDFQ